MTPQLLQDVVNQYYYYHPGYIVVGISLNFWFILRPFSNKLFYSFPTQHREFSDKYELWSGEWFFFLSGDI